MLNDTQNFTKLRTSDLTLSTQTTSSDDGLCDVVVINESVYQTQRPTWMRPALYGLSAPDLGSAAYNEKHR